MRIDLGDEETPEIGLIALIDCIFFLLMFFMVATSFKPPADGTAKALPLTLPQSAASLDAASATPEVLVIGVDVKGGVYWGREPVGTVELRRRLHAAAERNRDQVVRIDGDTRVAYQQIVHLLDLCQFEGLTRISLRTRDGR